MKGLRRLTARLGHACITGVWLLSAVGHVWLLGAGIGELSPVQVLALLSAVLISLLVARWHPTLFRSPVWALIFTLLIAMAHLPGGAPAALTAALIPSLFRADDRRGLVPLGFPLASVRDRPLWALILSDRAPLRQVGFLPALLSRPPPAAL